MNNIRHIDFSNFYPAGSLALFMEFSVEAASRQTSDRQNIDQYRSVRTLIQIIRENYNMLSFSLLWACLLLGADDHIKVLSGGYKFIAILENMNSSDLSLSFKTY